MAEFNPKSIIPEKFEYVDLESVNGTKMTNHRTEYKRTAPSRAQRLAKPKDIFYQTVRPYQKNNYLYNLPYDNYVFSTGYAQLRPDIDSYFLLSKLQEEKFIFNVLNRCTGTSYPAINSNDLALIKIKIPKTRDEQTQIGNFFKQLDNTITLYQRKLKLLNQLKQGFLQQLFPQKDEKVPRVRFNGFEEEWEQIQLGKIASITTGSKDVKDADIDGQYNFYIRSQNILRINSYSYDGEAILIGGDGNISELIHYYNGKFDFHQRVYKLSQTKKNSALYIYYYLKKFIGSELLKNSAKTTVDSVRMSTLTNFNVRLPVLDEQTKIANHINELNLLTKKYETQLNYLQTIKKAYLQLMFI